MTNLSVLTILFILFNNCYLIVQCIALSQRITNGLKLKYPSQDISRVMTSWDNFVAGIKLDRFINDDKEMHQIADCHVDGLKPVCFHDTSKWDWTNGLEKHYKEILSELKVYNKQFNIEDSSLDDSASWLSARNTEAAKAYGPQWKTLGLQDRGLWDEENVKFFPTTVRLINELNVPSCEVFFAKQAPKSGISPHSDRNNFILTCHLGLDVPEGECWIQVGNEKHYWKNGVTAAFDTSLIHSTQNLSDKARYVLMIRFWHPELSQVERDAFTFIFDFLDHSALGEESLELFETMHILMGKDKKTIPSAISSKTVVSASSKRSSSFEEELVKGKKKSENVPKRGFGKK